MAFRKIQTLIIVLVPLLASCVKVRECNAYSEYSNENLTSKNILVEYVMYRQSFCIVNDMDDVSPTDIYISDRSFSSYDVTDTTIGNWHFFESPAKNGDNILRLFMEGGSNDTMSFKVHEYHSLTERCSVIEPYFNGYAVYNLTDTTSVWQGRGALGRYRDGLIDRFVEKKHEYDPKNINEVHYIYHLTVTDSLLSLMQKDTSMLRLFPDYYGGE